MVPSGRRPLLTLLVTFYGLVDVSGAIACGKGMKVDRNRKGCEACPPNKYQPDATTSSNECLSCTNCDTDSWSETSSQCKTDRNTVCRCRPGFVAREKNFATCKCDKGSGLVSRGGKEECEKCKDGFFTDRINRRCEKWKECQLRGVKVSGTRVSDVVCNDQLDRTGSTTRDPSHRPSGPTPGRGPPRHSTSAFVSALVSTSRGEGPFTPVTPEPSVVNVVNAPGAPRTLLLIGSGVGLLLIVTLATVTCRLMIIPCVQGHTKKPMVKTRDSVCGRPVEESGDSSSALVKVDPEGP